MNLHNQTPSKTSLSAPWIITVGAVTFALGAVGAFTLSQINQSRQNDAIAVLAAQLAEMQVTRAQSPALLAIAAPSDMAVHTTAAIPSSSAGLAARANRTRS